MPFGLFQNYTYPTDTNFIILQKTNFLSQEFWLKEG